MSETNSKVSKANEMSELNDLTAGSSPKDVTKFRLVEINKIKDYFNAEIKEKKRYC